jgi:cytochrome c-type biogenesis protein CcsB
MDSSYLLGITTFAYLFSSLLYVFLLVFKTPRLGRVATIVTAIAFLVNTLGVSWRWIESYQLGFGRAPLTNMYESLVFFAWTIIAIYLVIERKFATRAIGPFAVPMAFLAMAYASFAGNIDKSISPLVPALQSNWLIAHVVTCFIGYAAFAIAAALGVMYLVKAHRSEGSSTDSKENEFLPSLPLLDDLIHKTMIFGFIWLSVGIITGAIWANSAWGTYWSWDPKETWSLITWFFYAITLHARYTRSWSGRRLAILALCGFASVMFTYFGVNFLLSGLHSYGSSS